MFKAWTPAEIELIKANLCYTSTEVQKMLKEMGCNRTIKEVSNKVTRLRYPQKYTKATPIKKHCERARWSQEEIALLKKVAHKKISEIANNHFPYRTYPAIKAAKSLYCDNTKKSKYNQVNGIVCITSVDNFTAQMKQGTFCQLIDQPIEGVPFVSANYVLSVRHGLFGKNKLSGAIGYDGQNIYYCEWAQSNIKELPLYEQTEILENILQAMPRAN